MLYPPFLRASSKRSRSTRSEPDPPPRPSRTRRTEDELDWQENQARPPEDLRRVDAMFLWIMAAGTAAFAAVVILIIRGCGAGG
jgi:hypothetical protein